MGASGSDEWRIPLPPLCVACGKRHGGVNLELNCLRAEVLRLRKEAAK
jgi:hypothetical protein